MLRALQRLARLQLWRQGARFSTFEADGFRLWYADLPPRSRAAGAPTLMLLHGLGSSATGYYRVVSGLRRRFRLVIPDLPGHGLSRLAGDRPFATFSEIAAAVERLVAHAAPEGAFVAGNSMGGWLAAELAARRPDLVRGLALLNPGGPELTPEAWREFEALVRRGDHAAALEYLQRLFHHPRWTLRFFVPEFQRVLQSPQVVRFLEALRPDDFLSEAEVGSIRVPSLLLWGESDRLLPPGCRAFYAEKLPGVRVVPLPACGHCPHLDAPERVVELVGALGA